jgi:ribose transport system substrate-binding protein
LKQWHALLNQILSREEKMMGKCKSFGLGLVVIALIFTHLIGLVAEKEVQAADDFISKQTIVGEGDFVDVSKFAKKGPYRIGFSNGFSGNSWRKMCIASLQREAKKYSEIEDLIILDGQGDVNKQINDIESLIAQEVDAILVIANSGTAVIPVLREATKLGIVTLPFNLPVEGEDFTAYVGVDPANKGERNAQFLKGAVGNNAKIVALGGLPGNSYTAAGWGAAEAVMKAAGTDVLAFRDAYWEEDRAKVIMSDLIAAYPQIDGVWADGGQVSTGALKALLAANKPLIPVCGDDYNGLLRMYDRYKDKFPEFKFSAISEPTWESAIALRTALQILKGEKVHFKQMIKPKSITPENYKDYFRSDLPDAVFVDTELSDKELSEIFGVSN